MEVPGTPTLFVPQLTAWPRRGQRLLRQVHGGLDGSLEETEKDRCPTAPVTHTPTPPTHRNIFRSGLVTPGPSKRIQTFCRGSFRGLVNSTVTTMSEPTA